MNLNPVVLRWYHNPIVMFFTAALGVMLAMWGYDAYKHRGDKIPTEQKAAIQHAATDSALAVVARVDTVRLPALVDYGVVRNRTRNVNPQAEAVGAAADKVIALDTAAIAARDTAFKRQGAELETWKAGCCKPPRLQAYGEALYDVAHMVPVLRAGATFRALGPIDLSASVEYAAPPATTANPGFRALAGLRYNF